MSAKNGIQYTKKVAGTTILPGYAQAPEQVVIDTITAAGETVGSTYTVGWFPKNAIPTELKVFHAALGTSAKLKAGDGTTADKFFAATAVATAGVIECKSTSVIGTKLTADTPIVLTSDTAAVTGVIVVVAKYTLA